MIDMFDIDLYSNDGNSSIISSNLMNSNNLHMHYQQSPHTGSSSLTNRSSVSPINSPINTTTNGSTNNNSTNSNFATADSLSGNSKPFIACRVCGDKSSGLHYGIQTCEVLFVAAHNVRALDNGLAPKPPMGWLAWTRFACNTDCDNYPNECINEKLFYKQAEVLAKEYLEYGYEYVNIDDCWSELSRDNKTQELVADRKRFPHGIKTLADFVHSKGLKLGIYGDIGTKTCAGYPGVQAEKGPSYYDIDAKTFANWEIDYLKVDGCFANTSDFVNTFPTFAAALNRTRRSIVYSCVWGTYQVPEQEKSLVDFNPMASSCNVWRNYVDIYLGWASVAGIIDFYAKHQDEYVQIHGPNQWFDPDMIITNGLSDEQIQAQMAMWSIWSAPLLISADLLTIRPEQKKILTNKHVIAINQHEHGYFGKQVYKEGNFEIWLKPLSPIRINNKEHFQYAVVYLNRETLGSPKYFSRTLRDMINGYGKSPKNYSPSEDLKKNSEQAIKYAVMDLFYDAAVVDTVRLDEALKLKVDVAGSVRMVKLVPQADL